MGILNVTPDSFSGDGIEDHDLAAAYAQTQVERGMPVVAMHNKDEARYDSVMDEVLSFLEEAAGRAVRAGIPAEHVILDPGIGFGKSADQNLRILQELPRVVALGFPTLLGTS